MEYNCIYTDNWIPLHRQRKLFDTCVVLADALSIDLVTISAHVHVHVRVHVQYIMHIEGVV